MDSREGQLSHLSEAPNANQGLTVSSLDRGPWGVALFIPSFEMGGAERQALELAQTGSLNIVQGAPASAAGANGGRIRSACAAARFPSSELSC